MDDASTIAALEQRVAELEALVARLATDRSDEAEAEAPRGSPTPPTPTDSAAALSTASGSTPGLDRRRLLTRGGTAAVGAVLGGAAATIATASPAAAATGTFDTTDATPALTATTSGSGPAVDASSSTGTAAIKAHGPVEVLGEHGLRVTADGLGPRPGTAAVLEGSDVGAIASGAHWGILTASDSFDSAGVLGHGGIGYGVLASGARANLLLKAPGFPYPAMPDPTTGDTAHQAGELYWSDDAVLWVCIADGTPGTWRRATGAGTAGALTMLPSPIRVYDSRTGYPPTGGTKTPLDPGVDRIVDCTNNTSGIPTDATAAIVTITIADPTGPGWLAVRANGAPYTGTSTLNWTEPGTVIATTTTTALGPDATIAIRAMTTTDAIVDVIGYHR